MASLKKIEGIGAKYAAKFEKAGVRTTDSLLDRAGTARGRKELASSTGINEKLVLRYANMADLFRVKGVGEEYADLLEAAGVDTVPELAQRNPKNLFGKMLEVNTKKRLVRQTPGLKQVEHWVGQAKKLPRALKY